MKSTTEPGAIAPEQLAAVAGVAGISRAAWLPATGRVFYAIAIVAFGVQHLVAGAFVTRVVPWWPAWIPGRAFWAALVGAVLVAAGAALVLSARARGVATLLGVGLLVSFVLLGLPLAATDTAWGGLWTVAGKVLALGGGAFLVARSLDGAAPGGPGPVGPLERLWPLGPWCFAAFLVLCGIQHFIHVAFVQSLVPTWIPGSLFWTYLTGVALVAGGLGVVIPMTARLAGLLSGAMIFTWVVVLHLPRALAGSPGSTNETTSTFEALAMSGIAVLIAAGARPPRP